MPDPRPVIKMVLLVILMSELATTSCLNSHDCFFST
jgi:hypothetical protein